MRARSNRPIIQLGSLRTSLWRIAAVLEDLSWGRATRQSPRAHGELQRIRLPRGYKRGNLAGLEPPLRVLCEEGTRLEVARGRDGELRAQDSSAERMRDMFGELANDVVYAAHPVAARIWSVIFSYYLASLI